jgi:hypothetical protein
MLYAVPGYSLAPARPPPGGGGGGKRRLERAQQPVRLPSGYLKATTSASQVPLAVPVAVNEPVLRGT